MKKVNKKTGRRLDSLSQYEEDIYCADFGEMLLEEGGISAAEAGFMRGYNEA